MIVLFYSPLITVFYVLVTSVDDTKLAEQQRWQDSVKETVSLSAELIDKNLEQKRAERDESLFDVAESIYILDEDKRAEEYSGKRSADLSMLLDDVGKNRRLIEEWFSTENLSVYSSPFLLFAIREYEEQLLKIGTQKEEKSSELSLPIALERLKNNLEFSLTGETSENYFILDLGDTHICLAEEAIILKISGIQKRHLKLRYGVVPQSEWGLRVTSLEGLVYLCHTSQNLIQSKGTSYQLSIFCLGWISVLLFVMLMYSSYRDRITREKLDVASTVAHEFRTPIAGSGVLIDNLLADQDIKSDKVKSYLKKMKVANQKLHQIAEHFFIEGALKQKNLKLEIVNFSEWIDEQWEEFNLIHQPDNVSLKSSVLRSDETILIDKVLLSLALQNILRNAYQYTREGSVTISLVEDINRLGIEVKDTGIGMDEFTVKNVLKKYKRGEDTLTRETEGLGLGLYLAQEIAKLHAGEITIVSTVDKGSIFTLWISK